MRPHWMLHELDLSADHEAVAGGLDLILAASREDGRIRVGPKSPMYPCYTAEASRVLARYGLLTHASAQRTVEYFLAGAHESGGWRCTFSRFGKGPETEFANPGATLVVLDTLRYAEELRSGHPVVDEAVESLLRHWVTREPLGPCHWGIGSKFMKTEYPFLRYNLFFFVYTLSFFTRAQSDPRFLEALAELESKVDDEGALVVEQPHRMLGRLEFCSRGKPSLHATRRLAEVRANLA